MQAFKLVNSGFVDRVIVFDSLPERFLKGVPTRDTAGFPRSWARWLADIGSLRSVMKTETTMDSHRNYTYKFTPIGKEPCFFVLDYTDLNADKERWREISEYVRMNVGPEVRLKEKLENMALQFAADPKDPLAIEPEDVPVVPVPEEIVKEKSLDELVHPDEQILIPEPATKRRGRPKKVEAEA